MVSRSRRYHSIHPVSCNHRHCYRGVLRGGVALRNRKCLGMEKQVSRSHRHIDQWVEACILCSCVLTYMISSGM